MLYISIMAGVIPSKRSTSGRKQWTYYDGSRSSLKRLRNQLANDGCPESQVVLAKQLLEEKADVDVDKEENARLGVYWLIKASEQGNTEATDLLKKCLENGEGITEHNCIDVKACITMTQDEKLARKAAREMFASLSNGGEYITSEQLQKKMLEIDSEEESTIKKVENVNGSCSGDASPNGELMNNFEESSESEEDWSQRSENNEKLTEENLVAAAVNYTHGQLPLVNRILCLNDPNLQALDHVPIIHRSVLHPLLALKILYYKVIRFLGRLPYSRMLRSDLQIILLLVIYTVISSENVLYIFPMIIYYLTIGVMVMATFKMLQTKREFYDFRIWSGLFIAYSGGSLNSDEAEFQFIRNNLKPYGHFFIALLINLLVYPIIVEQYIPQSELTIFSFCLTFMTLFGFMYKRRSKTVVDLLILFSFAVNVLAKYPYETDPVVTQGWRFLDLKIPTFASYIIGNGIEFCINFRTLLYAFIPVIFVRIAFRDNWRGIYKFLIPHCVTLSWLQIVIISSQGATMFGLIRGTLALVGFVLFLPLVGLTTIFLPAAALARWLVNSDYLYCISIFILLVIIGLSICFLLAKSRFKTYSSVLQMVFAITAIYFLLGSVIYDKNIIRRFTIENPTPKSLSYEQYQKYCPWDSGNAAKTQIHCSKLRNVQINWEGYISDIRIKTTKNKYKYFLDKLPETLSNFLYCYYGDKIEPDCNIKETDCANFYNIIKSTQKCTLDKFNIYTFEITISMQSGLWGKGVDIALQLNNDFKNFSLQLKKDDHVWFKGFLVSGEPPTVKVNELGCLGCADDSLSSAKIITDGGFDYRKLGKDVLTGLKTVLNFIFYPIVVFK